MGRTAVLALPLLVYRHASLFLLYALFFHPCALPTFPHALLSDRFLVSKEASYQCSPASESESLDHNPKSAQPPSQEIKQFRCTP